MYVNVGMRNHPRDDDAHDSTASAPSEPKMPKGKSASGSATSSTHVATVSNPTKANTTTEAPDMIPRMPFGANGVQFEDESPQNRRR